VVVNNNYAKPPVSVFDLIGETTDDEEFVKQINEMKKTDKRKSVLEITIVYCDVLLSVRQMLNSNT
jgi:hypothetical protein